MPMSVQERKKRETRRTPVKAAAILTLILIVSIKAITRKRQFASTNALC